MAVDGGAFRDFQVDGAWGQVVVAASILENLRQLFVVALYGRKIDFQKINSDAVKLLNGKHLACLFKHKLADGNY